LYNLSILNFVFLLETQIPIFVVQVN